MHQTGLVQVTKSPEYPESNYIAYSTPTCYITSKYWECISYLIPPYILVPLFTPICTSPATNLVLGHGQS